MNKYKKLFNNSIIFAIGNMGSKFIGIIMVALYTNYFTTSDYGKLDLFTTTINLLVPVFSFSINEATFRFAMDKNQDKEGVLINSVVVTFFGMLLLTSISMIFVNFKFTVSEIAYLIILVGLQSFQVLFAQFTRAIGMVKLFAMNGIVMAISLALLNVLTIVNLRMGVTGYLLSLIISNLISIVYFFFGAKIWRYFKYNKLNKNLARHMLFYSIPLIPNTFLWWMTNASNRYFITFIIGASANGLFAVANKIPTLLSMVNSIFTQAWQISAVEEESNKDDFYSQMFDVLAYILFVSSSLILTVLKPTFLITIGSDFFVSWKYVPALLLSVIFSSFSNFYGVVYLVVKDTVGVFKTTIIGGLMNIILNYILIMFLGLQGAGIATLISFLLIWVLRIRDSRRFITITLNIKKILTMIILLIIQTLFLFLSFNIYFEIFNGVFINIIFLFMGKNYISLIFKRLRG